MKYEIYNNQIKLNDCDNIEVINQIVQKREC